MSFKQVYLYLNINKFFLKTQFIWTGLVSVNEFLELNANKYYHIELYCKEGENRRTNTLYIRCKWSNTV